MYMRNNRYNNKHAKYNIDGFPPNYSGQFSEESLLKPAKDAETEHLHNDLHEKKEKEPEEIKEKRDGSLLGNLFKGGQNKDGKKGGLLSGLFSKGDNKDSGIGGLLSNIELEDLILLAVIFFLLKDGFEDDIIIILAIILFSS